jgi:hypothetical protein
MRVASVSTGVLFAAAVLDSHSLAGPLCSSPQPHTPLTSEAPVSGPEPQVPEPTPGVDRRLELPPRWRGLGVSYSSTKRSARRAPVALQRSPTAIGPEPNERSCPRQAQRDRLLGSSGLSAVLVEMKSGPPLTVRRKPCLAAVTSIRETGCILRSRIGEELGRLWSFGPPTRGCCPR